MTTSNNTDRRTAPVNLLIAPMAPLILVCLTILQIHFADGTRDTKPPVFTFCPKDVTVETVTQYTRVNWDHAKARDNSGIPPIMHSTRQPGAMFGVGEETITYTAEDQAGNRACPCKFKVIVKKKQCLMHPPPKNGVLTCLNQGGDVLCSVACKESFDFAFDPPLFYMCGSGQWHPWHLIPGQPPFQWKLPWPDCTKRDSPSFLKRKYPNLYQYSGNEIKGELLKLLKNPALVAPFVCREQCTVDNMKVYRWEVAVVSD